MSLRGDGAQNQATDVYRNPKFGQPEKQHSTLATLPACPEATAPCGVPSERPQSILRVSVGMSQEFVPGHAPQLVPITVSGEWDVTVFMSNN